jgi:hypothetical protein
MAPVIHVARTRSHPRPSRTRAAFVVVAVALLTASAAGSDCAPERRHVVIDAAQSAAIL